MVSLFVSRPTSEGGTHSLTVKSRGHSWSFEWGICFPLACIHSLGICAVVCFPITAILEAEEFRYRLPYLAICLALALLTLLLSKRLIFCSLSWRY